MVNFLVRTTSAGNIGIWTRSSCRAIPSFYDSSMKLVLATPFILGHASKVVDSLGIFEIARTHDGPFTVHRMLLAATCTYGLVVAFVAFALGQSWFVGTRTHSSSFILSAHLPSCTPYCNRQR